MAERKVKVTLPDGKVVEGTDVSIRDSSEKWSEITLEDGSVIRIKASVLGATRIDGRFDNDGNPEYAVKTAMITVVHSSPDNLKKKKP